MTDGNGGDPRRRVTVTGGAGFIGTNLVDRLASRGHRVLVYDDLSRPGVDENLRWLRNTHGDRIAVEVASVEDRRRLRRAVTGADAVFHLAAQVAVTTSIEDPADDFDVNLGGTLNLLESLRGLDDPPHLFFSSTNKVYGRLADLELKEGESAYRPADPAFRTGVGEDRALEFRTPYGCSKGGADQYVLDYARMYGLPTTVFRMSCVYGPHQHGTEDQGWVAHFLIRALRGLPITIFGDGKQVRDILYVSDLVDAFLAALERRETVAGRAFNIGGGPENAISLLELVDDLRRLCSGSPEVRFEDWRSADQRWYVSDVDTFRDLTGWSPDVTKTVGVRRLHRWLLRSGRVPVDGPRVAVAG